MSRTLLQQFTSMDREPPVSSPQRARSRIKTVTDPFDCSFEGSPALAVVLIEMLWRFWARFW